jgi:hypothetical protein
MIEFSWSQNGPNWVLKVSTSLALVRLRSVKGTYVSIEPFHLFRHLDGQAFRFNNRKGTDATRCALAPKGIINERLTQVALTGSALAQTC